MGYGFGEALAAVRRSFDKLRMTLWGMLRAALEPGLGLPLAAARSFLDPLGMTGPAARLPIQAS
jgi:hypothetical protein